MLIDNIRKNIGKMVTVYPQEGYCFSGIIVAVHYCGCQIYNEEKKITKFFRFSNGNQSINRITNDKGEILYEKFSLCTTYTGTSIEQLDAIMEDYGPEIAFDEAKRIISNMEANIEVKQAGKKLLPIKINIKDQE